MIDSNWLGSDKTSAEYDAIGMAISETHRSVEASLFASKWIEYKLWHPVRATYYFAECYRRQTTRWMERNRDLLTAEDCVAFTPSDIFKSEDMTSMWLARQSADQHGMTYPFVMEQAMTRFVERAFHRFPRPNQLYGEEFEMDTRDAWQEQLTRSLQYSRDPQTIQDPEHEGFVVQQILARQAGHANLLGRMFKEGVLRPKRMVKHFGSELTIKAVRVAASLGWVVSADHLL
jgi:hypothetical protein